LYSDFVAFKTSSNVVFGTIGVVGVSVPGLSDPHDTNTKQEENTREKRMCFDIKKDKD
jgi:hypothetical protein